MSHFSENLVLICFGIVGAVVLSVCWAVIRSRQGRPMVLHIKGFGVEVRLAPERRQRNHSSGCTHTSRVREEDLLPVTKLGDDSSQRES